jgi:hypothetical protein
MVTFQSLTWFWSRQCEDILGFKDYGYNAVEGKTCAFSLSVHYGHVLQIEPI